MYTYAVLFCIHGCFSNKGLRTMAGSSWFRLKNPRKEVHFEKLAYGTLAGVLDASRPSRQSTADPGSFISNDRLFRMICLVDGGT